MILTVDDLFCIEEAKQYLTDHFETKDFESLSYFLGCAVLSSNYGVSMSQAKYASNLQ